MSKTDFRGVFSVARKTQQVASWSRDGVSRGARCVRDSNGHVLDARSRQVRIKVTLQRVSFLSDC